jgi:hypothetical protein
MRPNGFGRAIGDTLRRTQALRNGQSAEDIIRSAVVEHSIVQCTRMPATFVANGLRR